MKTPRRRLAIVLSHPTQYYSPWFRWLAAHTDLQLRVFYLWDFGMRERRDPQFGTAFAWDVDLLSGYDWELIPNVARDPGTHHFGGLRNPALPRRLAEWKPEAILLFGYAGPALLRTVLWARTHRVPLVFRGDSHFLGRGRPGWRTRLALRLLYRQFGAVTYVGAANRRYFDAVGVPARRLFFAPHAVDAERFGSGAPEAAAAAARLRAALGLEPAAHVVLFAGKLVPAKQPKELLEAFLAVAGPTDALVFVGEGAERPGLEAIAAAHPGARVRFLPFANQSEMPARYHLADIFALPSRGWYETWGLAVNEAMHCGVPCLVSDLVGCQEDLVIPDRTGWVFRAGDPGSLARVLAQALTAVRERRRELGAAAQARAAAYTYGPAAEGLLRALDSLP